MPLQKRTYHSGNHTTRIHFHLISIQSPKIMGCKNRAIRHTSEKYNITCSQKGIQIHYRRSNIGKYIIKYICVIQFNLCPKARIIFSRNSTIISCQITRIFDKENDRKQLCNNQQYNISIMKFNKLRIADHCRFSYISFNCPGNQCKYRRSEEAHV